MMCSAISTAITLANFYPPLLLDDYNQIEQTVSREFRWYLIGLTCLLVVDKSFQSDSLNDFLTRTQIAQNSGYSEGTMTRFVSYANAITRMQKVLPDLVTDILAGKTRLGLKTTIILAKLPPDDIVAIMKRVEVEQTSIRKIISEQIRRPLTYPRKFSDGRSTKSSPKTIKDFPR